MTRLALGLTSEPSSGTRLLTAALGLALVTANAMPASAQTLSPAPLDSFSIAVIPDSQHYLGRGTKLHRDSGDPASNPILDSHMRWISANVHAQKIAMATHVGDIVDRRNPEQWAVARAGMDRLHGLLPYAVAPGNHDMAADGTSTDFVAQFGPSRFSGLPWWGGTFTQGGWQDSSRDGASSFQLFSACDLDFLVMHLECNAPDNVLAWANRIIEAHPNRRVIVVTHMGLGPVVKPEKNTDFISAPKGRMRWKKVHGDRGNTPQQMWDKCFRRHRGLFLILNGDQSRTQAMRQVSISDHGTAIYELLSDYNRENHPWMRLMRFLPQSDAIDVITFDSSAGTLCSQTETVPNSEEHCFTIAYPMRGAPRQH